MVVIIVVVFGIGVCFAAGQMTLQTVHHTRMHLFGHDFNKAYRCTVRYLDDSSWETVSFFSLCPMLCTELYDCKEMQCNIQVV